MFAARASRWSVPSAFGTPLSTAGSRPRSSANHCPSVRPCQSPDAAAKLCRRLRNPACATVLSSWPAGACPVLLVGVPCGSSANPVELRTCRVISFSRSWALCSAVGPSRRPSTTSRSRPFRVRSSSGILRPMPIWTASQKSTSHSSSSGTFRTPVLSSSLSWFRSPGSGLTASSCRASGAPSAVSTRSSPTYPNTVNRSGSRAALAGLVQESAAVCGRGRTRKATTTPSYGVTGAASIPDGGRLRMASARPAPTAASSAISAARNRDRSPWARQTEVQYVTVGCRSAAGGAASLTMTTTAVSACTWAGRSPGLAGR